MVLSVFLSVVIVHVSVLRHAVLVWIRREVSLLFFVDLPFAMLTHWDELSIRIAVLGVSRWLLLHHVHV